MWDAISKPWQAAFEQGWEAFCNGSIPIGAVIANEDGHVISTGRNRLYERSRRNPKVAHAETEAVQNLDMAKYPYFYTYTLYACMEPCPMCMGTIVMGNLRKLCVAARDSYCGAVHYCADDPYIASKNMHVIFEYGLLERVQLTLQAYFNLRADHGEINRVTALFERDDPQAVEIAQRFYAARYLDDCVVGGVPFSKVFEQIARQST